MTTGEARTIIRQLEGRARDTLFEIGFSGNPLSGDADAEARNLARTLDKIAKAGGISVVIAALERRADR